MTVCKDKSWNYECILVLIKKKMIDSFLVKNFVSKQFQIYFILNSRQFWKRENEARF